MNQSLGEQESCLSETVFHHLEAGRLREAMSLLDADKDSGRLIIGGYVTLLTYALNRVYKEILSSGEAGRRQVADLILARKAIERLLKRMNVEQATFFGRDLVMAESYLRHPLDVLQKRPPPGFFAPSRLSELTMLSEAICPCQRHLEKLQIAYAVDPNMTDKDCLKTIERAVGNASVCLACSFPFYCLADFDRAEFFIAGAINLGKKVTPANSELAELKTLLRFVLKLLWDRNLFASQRELSRARILVGKIIRAFY